jgi:protein RecA
MNNGMLPEGLDLTKIDGYDPTTRLGLPMGRVVEIFGEEGGGKSSLAYRVIGNAQKQGLSCAWIDTEQSFSDNLARINGMDRDDVYFADMSNLDDPDKLYYAEDVFDSIVKFINAGVKVIVLDSVANLIPKAVMERNADQPTVGILARLMSDQLKKIVNHAGKNGALVIFINQLREKVGVTFGSPETTPGGRSLKHNASMRLQVNKKNSKEADINAEDAEGNNILIGRRATVYIKKNRMAKPFFEPIEIPIYFEPYFPNIEETLFSVGRQLGLISVRQNIFNWKQIVGDTEVPHKVEGKVPFIQYIVQNELQYPLAIEIQSKSKELGAVLPPEVTLWIRDNAELANKTPVESNDTDAGTDVEKPHTRGRKAKNS